MANDYPNESPIPQDRLVEEELDLLAAHLPELLKLLAEMEAQTV